MVLIMLLGVAKLLPCEGGREIEKSIDALVR